MPLTAALRCAQPRSGVIVWRCAKVLARWLDSLVRSSKDGVDELIVEADVECPEQLGSNSIPFALGELRDHM